jgi:putative ABC transport system ATP-binding protein
MLISFENVMPLPLSGISHHPKSIWGKCVQFAKGQRTCIDAASGKGKTTFTHLLAGLRSDYTGVVHIDGQDSRELTFLSWSELRQTKLSFVFQDLQLFDQLTVRENLVLKNDLHPVYTENEMLDLVHHLGIGDKWNVPCRMISMGQQQRVAIVRALCQPFDLLVMDEPFSHLDDKTALNCLEIINKRTDEQQAGFILTTLGSMHGQTFDQYLMI